VAHRIAACNQLRAHLAVAFPGAIGLFAHLDSQISLAFLARFGSQDAAGPLGEDELAGWLRTLPSRGNPATPGQLRDRLHAAPRGVTGAEGTAQAAVTGALVATLTTLAAQIKALEAEIAAQLAAHPGAHIFTSLPRAGTVRAAAARRDRRLPGTVPRPRVAGRPGRSRPGHPPVRQAHLGRVPVGGQPPAPRRRLRLRRRLPPRQLLGRGDLPCRPRPRQRPPARRAHLGPRLDLRDLALLAGRHRL
jgi:hypothetical protein